MFLFQLFCYFEHCITLTDMMIIYLLILTCVIFIQFNGKDADKDEKFKAAQYVQQLKV